MNEAALRAALAREVGKLTRQSEAIKATEAMIAMIEDQIKNLKK